MDAIMALCKRRGFIYQASEIYGGINGFWDYGPLGAMLKRNLREAWWQDMIQFPCWGRKGPNGEKLRCLPLETCIIQHPKVWEASGHVGGFNDPMVDCKESKKRYRADQLAALGLKGDTKGFIYAFIGGDDESKAQAVKKLEKEKRRSVEESELDYCSFMSLSEAEIGVTVGPDVKKAGTLTPPRQFNLMFHSYTGAVFDEDNKVYLRPETAQGIFVQFKNVVDTNRVKMPFGIGNVGKSFRNEITPRNFTFRSREFEQAELEFFCHPSESREWYAFWRDFRMEWWQALGLAGENLRLREHEKDELSHYSTGTSDVEYRFPFTAPDFGELEGIAHRGCYDLEQHQKHSGVKLEFFDTERGEILPNGSKKGERYLPHVIEPAAGIDRGVLAIICEGYTRDESRPSPEIMKFHPRLAPIKAAVFPLVNKDGMPEVAERLHEELQQKFGRIGIIDTDPKQSIGKRYARMDEAGCPFCFTIDGDTLKDQTVTVRDRDTGAQERIAIDRVSEYLSERLGI
jgi:glycyl-tRNA synthetase